MNVAWQCIKGFHQGNQHRTVALVVSRSGIAFWVGVKGSASLSAARTTGSSIASLVSAATTTVPSIGGATTTKTTVR